MSGFKVKIKSKTSPPLVIGTSTSICFSEIGFAERHIFYKRSQACSALTLILPTLLIVLTLAMNLLVLNYGVMSILFSSS